MTLRCGASTPSTQFSEQFPPAEAGTDRPEAALLAFPRKSLMVEAFELVQRDERALAVWEPLVLEALRLRYQDHRTREKVVVGTERLFRYLDAQGAVCWDEVTADLVLEWCRASRPDSSGDHKRLAESTVKNNQWKANQALTEAAALGAPFHLHELLSKNVKRPTEYVSARPLTDDEAELVRTFADPGFAATRRSLAVAFSFAGGSATEIAAVRMRDVDTKDWTVAFRGDAARICPLDSWGIETVQRHLRTHPPLTDDELLCTAKRTTARTHSVTVQLGMALEVAGLRGLPGVSARSIRLTTAHKISQADGIEAAARFLGASSLDNTAYALRYLWRHLDG